MYHYEPGLKRGHSQPHYPPRSYGVRKPLSLLITERHDELGGSGRKLTDVRSMVDLADKSINLGLSKGTIDAMMYGTPWSPPDEVEDSTSRYMKYALHQPNTLAHIFQTSHQGLSSTERQRNLHLHHVQAVSSIQPLLNPDWHLGP
ncbi:hypothetical protein BKA56DRAFT_609739 [Ilyonectria sp. MPI-CAGE-AT-0026]|nr:hypothetical protein BKA56DRAFT_609739 [Ilyonectria sp. MPI-CAGE-AT-0026]